MNHLIFVGLVSALVMSGCAAKYSCIDGDSGVHCRPLTEVAKESEGAINDYRIPSAGMRKGRGDVRRDSWSFNFKGGSEGQSVDKQVINTPLAVNRPTESKSGADTRVTTNGLSSEVKTPKTTILSRVETGDPILTKPKVAAIYYTPYKDMQGDLNLGGYIYVKITDSEWVLTK